MRKNTYTLLSLLLVVLLLITAITGCGGGADSSEPESSDLSSVSDTSMGGDDTGSDVLGGDDTGSDVLGGDDTGSDVLGGDDTENSAADSSDTPDNGITQNDSTTTTTIKGGFAATSSTTRVSSVDSTIGKVNLKGYEFVIATHDIPVAGSNDYDDAVLARNTKLEKELNCTIRYEYYNDVTLYSDVSPLIMAGDKVADMFLMPMHHVGRFINSQYLYDLNDLKQINQKSVCYDQIGFTQTTLASGTYGMLGSAVPWKSGGCIVYNKDLLKIMGLTDPVEYVKKNNWTWDTFKTMVSKSMKDLDNDGAYTSADQWAVTGDRYDGVCAFFNSSGNGMLTVQNKKFAYTLDTEKSLDALANMKSIFAIPGGIYNPDMILDTNKKQFTDGKAVFWLGTLNWYRDFSLSMDDSLGIVPMPKGNNANDYVSAVTHNNCIAAVPITIDNPTATGTIIQRMFEVAYENKEDELSVKVYTDTFQDETCLEMYNKYIAPGMYFDAAMLCKSMSLNVYNATEVVVGNPIILNQEAYVAAELIESYKDTCVKFLKVLSAK